MSQWGHDFRPDYQVMSLQTFSCPHILLGYFWRMLNFSVVIQGLGILKQKFPTVPVLALTATATMSVKEDVVQALGLANCIIFRQSFNRPNLRWINNSESLVVLFHSWPYRNMIVIICRCCRYSVIPKTKKCLEDIDNFIKKFHFDQCGIIYCLSRMDCERVAEKLQVYHKASLFLSIFFLLFILLVSRRELS